MAAECTCPHEDEGRYEPDCPVHGSIADKGRVITLELHLPLPINAVSHVLTAITEMWPHTKIDLNGPNGWLIKVPPEDVP